jgi:agmatine/peptidylarginine deiminase
MREAGFDVTRIPMPDNRRRRVFRTYTNVLVLNQTVLVPTFRQNRRHERRALRAFAEAYPDRRIVGIVSDGVMGLAGALHCTAIAVPALRPPGAVARARRPRVIVPQRRG